MAKKRFNSTVYTCGKFGKRLRETLDTDNECLYAHGRYPTKIKAEDLPSDYIKFHSRSIWYMHGFLKTSGIVDIGYRACLENHLFKDDYIYISYKEKLRKEKGSWGIEDYANYDVCICGNSIIPIVLAAEKNSGVDISEVKKLIEEKRLWLLENYPEEVPAGAKECDLFTYWETFKDNW
ncbi:MAG: hypothetical protein PUJ82_03665 [Spirochaetales bacterium]|nr:hypothetical protein [Spirochaetales bacterium]MDY5913913.1 hypothetical protein [Treponema sp.]